MQRRAGWCPTMLIVGEGRSREYGKVREEKTKTNGKQQDKVRKRKEKVEAATTHTGTGMERCRI